MSFESRLEKEEEILENQLNNEEISLQEYNDQFRELQRDARDYYQEEKDYWYDEWCRRYQ